MTSLYFLLAALFVGAHAVTGMVAVRSASKLRFLAPVSLVLGVLVSFYGLDALLGSAKPVGVVPGWSEPVFGEEGATVLGGKFTGDTAWLLLQEEGFADPRLWLFPSDSELVKNLKKAMDQHGKQNGGQQWGFKIKKNGQAGDGRGGDGAGEGRGKGDAEGGGQHQDKSLETRPSPYKFELPQKKALPDKPYQAPVQEFRADRRA